MENGLSVADAMALGNGNRDSFLEGNGIVILILFILMFSGGLGGGFGGWGNGVNNAATQGALTRAELQDGFNFEEVKTGLLSNSHTLDSHNVAMLNATSNIQQNLLSGFAGVQSSVCNGVNNINSNIAQQGFNNQQAFCDIKTAIHDEGEETRALITQNTIQNLRDTVANKDRELLTAGLVAAQAVQTNNLENYMNKLVNGCNCAYA